MIKTKQLKLTPLALALSVGLMAAAPAHADERESLETLRQTTLNLIEALVETGVLPREKADALIQAAREKAQAQAQAAADAAAAPTEATPAKRVLRVPYVPESVRAQIRDEVKEEIITQARAERWGVPGAPSWMNRIKIDGDIRVRYQNDSQSKNNTAAETYMSSEILNANGISRAPDFGNYLINDAGNALPTADTTQSRNRERVRLRLGLTAKVTDEVGVGVRLATGSATDRVSTNQTLGQSFNKYELFVDRAFVRVDPAEWVSIQGGRIPNPWFATEMTWNENLNFEGFAATFRRPQVDDGFAPFLTLGYFPLRENSASRNRRSLVGAQLGTSLEVSSRTRVKLGLAYYRYNNIAGRAETDFEQFTDPDTNTVGIAVGQRYGQYEYPVGLRQRGNTVFETNPLLPVADGVDLIRPTWGLAYDFRPLVLTASAQFTHFSPFNLLLSAEYAYNTAFSESDFRKRSNYDLNPGGRRDGYNLKLAVGATEVRDMGDWQAQFAYRHVGSDAVLDAFTDSDLGLGGTNLRGFTVGFQYGLYRNTTVGVRYMSAQNIDTTINSSFPTASYKVNTLQVDFNVRF
ncbi:putative porin [Aquabacterium sp. A3]|uniref:putative porin n=1 Tax=Aquabacterium sp. A3 TaxID=3132829 RepID=UPI003119F785